jgi:DNA mismatch repair protein MutL
VSRIKILSEHLANQIAAGEVIERPASVVKELLENAIDAGAGQVQIEVEGSGTKLIRIVDDGTGMGPDDALLCLERHATSKLTETPGISGSRLDAIKSLGFRGEAIPSIASVARMTITTRSANEVLGTRVEVRYGRLLKVHETGCNKGTVLEVRDLFGNLPARKKFLKSSRTELFHIEEIIKNYALAHYRLGITYSHNGSRVLVCGAGSDSLKDRVRTLYAGNRDESLIVVGDPEKVWTPAEGINVCGFLLSPENSFGATARLKLFVNNRAVKDRMMAHAVREGLSGFLMKGRSAAGVIFVMVPYETVDVNVHPTKQEIRFLQPNRVHEQISAAVRKGMTAYQQDAQRFIFGSRKKRRDAGPGQAVPGIPLQTGQGKRLFRTNSGSAPAAGAEFPATGESPAPFSPASFFSQVGEEKRATTGEPLPSYGEAPADAAALPGVQALEPIGQFMDLYLLCEARRAGETFLVVIDQHAAHERILFEKLKAQFASREITSQKLLFPKLLELNPEYRETLAANREELQRLGLYIEDFGGASSVVKAVPAVLSHLDPEETVNGILLDFVTPDCSGGGRRRDDATRLDDVLSSMACRAAVKAGQGMEKLEIKELLKLMQESSAFTHCPHGRPVVRLFSAADIKKWFHRT